MDNDYQALKDQLSQKAKKANPFEQYGFLRNPFPKAGETTADPSYNQDTVKKAFEAKFVSFVQNDGESSDRLLIYGDQRVGKTNFLLHWQHRISKLLEDGVTDGYIPIYLTVASDNFLDDVHKPLVMELSKAIFPPFFETIQQNHDPAFRSQSDNFTQAIVATTKALEAAKDRLLSDDIAAAAAIRLFAKWFGGEKCTPNELKTLGGVFSSIDTASLAINYFRDFIRLSRRYKGRYKVLRGLIVFLDEFELVFGKAVPPSKRARYLQDLRHFIDMTQEGVLLVVASSSTILTEFQRDYAALKNRFGETQELQAIRSLDEARGYAKAYLDFGPKIYPREQSKKGDFKPIITEEEIADIYEEVQKEHKGAQGWFFAKLHDRVEEKVGKQEGE